MNEKIYVTQPSLPPLEEFIPYLNQIWSNKILTNAGPFHQELEKALRDYLQVKYISLFTNGTVALITALQALDIRGQVITTPYSFVATAHSLLWNGIDPIFVDIDPKTFNIDPSKIEAAITPETSAILAVHCYGHPCYTEAIQSIADANNLKVIYDAAHAFGIECDCGSILNHGDLSILSFHATKVFNTFEGGAIISNNLEMKKNIDRLKNFGFVDELNVVNSGINGKMSEFNAALGILQLNYIDDQILKRKSIDSIYRDKLKDIKGISCISNFAKVSNYSYFPVLVNDDYPITRDQLYDKLKKNNIYARRYFYPLISDFPIYKQYDSAQDSNLLEAKKIAKMILCLPIYSDLKLNDQQRVIDLIREIAKP
jgi:dTDP-4-amino-4,6-dideoxygalactose transaminase